MGNKISWEKEQILRGPTNNHGAAKHKIKPASNQEEENQVDTTRVRDWSWSWILAWKGKHALVEVVGEGQQREKDVEAYGLSLFGKKQNLQSEDKDLEGQVEENFEEEERARQAQDFGWGFLSLT